MGERGIASLQFGGCCILSVIGGESLTIVGRVGYLQSDMQGKSTTTMIIVRGSHRTWVRMPTVVIVARGSQRMRGRGDRRWQTDEPMQLSH